MREYVDLMICCLATLTTASIQWALTIKQRPQIAASSQTIAFQVDLVTLEIFDYRRDPKKVAAQRMVGNTLSSIYQLDGVALVQNTARFKAVRGKLDDLRKRFLIEIRPCTVTGTLCAIVLVIVVVVNDDELIIMISGAFIVVILAI